MKKGFTLVELLGVLVIMSIIAVIVLPIVGKNVKKGKEEAYQAQLISIINSTKNYTTDYPSALPTSGSTSITMSVLKSNGYLDSTVKNPKTSAAFADTDYVRITLTTTTSGGTCSTTEPCTSYCYCVVVSGNTDNCTKRCS